MAITRIKDKDWWKIMGIEFDCEIPLSKVVIIPIAGMEEHYLKEGFTIKRISMEQQVIEEYDGTPEQKKRLRASSPNCKVIVRSGRNVYVDPDRKSKGIILELEAIKK